MSSPQAPNGVLQARRRFFETGVAPADLVPAPILRSWQRCAALGLKGATRPAIDALTSTELRARNAHHEQLRRLCRPEIEALYADAKATDSIILLTDAEGMVLDSLGAPDFAQRAARVALRPGVSWSEAACGTNAIGMALLERRAVEVRGGEHYFEPHGILSCSAVPIRGPQGSIMGVLDLSGHASVHHLHALGMVRMAVDQIEHRLFDQGFEQQQLIRLHSDAALLGTPREGVLVFDNNRLVAANGYGLALLGLGWEDLGQRRAHEMFTGSLEHLADGGAVRGHDGRILHGRLHTTERRVLPAALPAPRPPAPHKDTAPEPLFSPGVLAGLERAVKLLGADVPVLVQGETGAGKEVFARAAHQRSRRRQGPFVAVNCGSLPEGLIEAELFGYEDGAFTGARRQGAKGLLREADGGTLFLDEIGDMPLALQVRLLRALQEREVQPLGGGKPVRVDFAVICATHRDLRRCVAEGSFRADLFFRVAQYTVALPCLRTLPDRAALIAQLWQRLGATSQGLALTADSVQMLAAYDWPGNFRQLTGTLRALMALAEPDSPITPDALPADMQASLPPINHTQPCLDAIEVQAMQAALAACGGNMSRAAQQLGISRSTLYRRLKG